MSDWFDKIADIIASPEEHVPTVPEKNDDITLTFNKKRERDVASTFSYKLLKRNDPIFKKTDLPSSIPPSSTPQPVPRKEIAMAPEDDQDENLKALKKLRDLPRG